MNIKLLKEVGNKYNANTDYLNNEYNYWEEWYKGKVDNFHNYNILVNGIKTKCEMKSFGMPKLVCESFSTLTTGNVIDIDFIENEELENQVYNILNENNFLTSYQKFIEKVFLYGMGATIQYLEEDKIKIDFVDADSFIPLEIENGVIKKLITISQNIIGDKKIENRILIHSIENGIYFVETNIYISDDTHSLGKLIPSESNIKQSFGKTPKFQVYNLPIQNNKYIHSQIGISILANCVDNFKKIDEVYDSLSNEIILGRKRIFVGKSAMGVKFDEEGNSVQYFDSGQGVYQTFNDSEMESGSPIIESNMQLRISDLEKALELEKSNLALKLQLNANFFLSEKGGSKTATEIRYMEFDTQNTKIKYQTVFLEQLENMINAIVEILGYDVEKEKFTLSFGYGINQNEGDKQATLLQEFSLGLISQEEYLREAKGFDKEQIKNIINEQNGVEEEVKEKIVESVE